jgi:hypothetical protein
MLFSPAGTRPEPAVSLPRAIGTIPAATATGRAGARPAGDELRPKRVSRHAIGRANADETRRELVEVGLSDDEGAGQSEPRHGFGVLLGRIGEIRAGAGRRQAGDVDVVLDRNGDAEQRPSIRPEAASASASARTSLLGRSVMNIAGSSWAAMRRYTSSTAARGSSVPDA